MVVLYYIKAFIFPFLQRCETNLEVLRYDDSPLHHFLAKLVQRDFELCNTSELYWFKDRQCCYVYLLISCTCSIPLE